MRALTPSTFKAYFNSDTLCSNEVLAREGIDTHGALVAPVVR